MLAEEHEYSSQGTGKSMKRSFIFFILTQGHFPHHFWRERKGERKASM